MEANKEILYKHVEFLTSIRPYRNYLNLESLKSVKEFIKKEFESYGLGVSEQSWNASGNEYHNVIASFKPEKSKRLIVGAHYDVCGDQPGADDNASAVAGLLEASRIIAKLNPNIDYGIDFVAYCLEEPPFFATESMGSYVHAKSLSTSDLNVIGMICYEMIGYFSDEPKSQNFPDPMLATIYPNTGNFIILVGIEKYRDFNEKFFSSMIKDAKIDVQKIWFPKRDMYSELSDHRSYWDFGIPALMINDTSFLRNPNYHETTDTIDTLDFDKMTAVVTSSIKGIINF